LQKKVTPKRKPGCGEKESEGLFTVGNGRKKRGKTPAREKQVLCLPMAPNEAQKTPEWGEEKKT